VVSFAIELSEAKDQLARLVDQVDAGAEVTLTRDGQPVARLVPPLADRVPGSAKGVLTMSDDFDPPLADRVPGSAKGMFRVPDDFDAPLEDFNDYM
jgi:prevent-host-death family protein